MVASRIFMLPRSISREVLAYRAPLLVFGVGMGVAASAYLLLSARDEQQNQRDFEQRAAAYGLVLQNNLERHISGMQGLSTYFAAMPPASADEFSINAARYMGVYPEMQAIEWVPWVDASHRAWAEQEIRSTLPTFKGLQELSPDGGLVAAAGRAWFYPVLYVQPVAGNEAAVGLDLASSPPRLAALEHARDSGEPIASEPITLVQETGNQQGMLLFVPVYGTVIPPGTIEDRRVSLQGFVVGVYRVADLISEVTAVMNEALGGICFTVFDPTAPDLLLYDNRSPHDSWSPPYESSIPISFAGQEWQLAAWPSESFMAAHDNQLLLYGVSGGVAFVIATALLLANRTRQGFRSRSAALKLATINRELRESAKINESLFSIASVLARPGDIRQQMREALRVLVSMCGASSATLGVWHSGDRQFLVSFGAGSWADSPEVLRRQPSGLIDRTLRSGSTVVVNDFLSFYPSSRFAKAGVRSVVAYPIHLEPADLEAVIVVRAMQAWHFTPERIYLLERMTGPLSVLIQNSRLRDALDQERAITARKDDFISVASHELRTPLTALVGFSGLLLDRSAPQGMHDSLLNRIHRNALRLTRIINELLDLSRISREPLQLESTRVETKAFITELLATFSGATRADDVRLDLSHAPSHFEVDPDLLSRVLLNLLDNAAKYSPQGSPIELTVATEQNGTVFTVADHGIGMDPRDAERVFSPYYRSANQRVQSTPGTGIGLYVVHELVQQMGGSVSVESIQGEGARFRVHLRPQLSEDEEPAGAR